MHVSQHHIVYHKQIQFLLVNFKKEGRKERKGEMGRGEKKGTEKENKKPAGLMMMS